MKFDNDAPASFFKEYLADVADIENMEDGSRLKFQNKDQYQELIGPFFCHNYISQAINTTYTRFLVLRFTVHNLAYLRFPISTGLHRS